MSLRSWWRELDFFGMRRFAQSVATQLAEAERHRLRMREWVAIRYAKEHNEETIQALVLETGMPEDEVRAICNRVINKAEDTVLDSGRGK